MLLEKTRTYAPSTSTSLTPMASIPALPRRGQDVAGVGRISPVRGSATGMGQLLPADAGQRESFLLNL